MREVYMTAIMEHQRRFESTRQLKCTEAKKTPKNSFLRNTMYLPTVHVHELYIVNGLSRI